ncbi:mitochondrial thiamine pyrophosphate transporter, partial [Cymbomonas tetramitiformis]
MPAPVTASRLWPPLLRKLWQDTTTVSLAAAGTSVTQWQEFISELRDAGASVPNMTANACRMAAAFKTDPDKVFLVRGAACGVGFPFKSVPEDTFYTVENYVPAEHWEAMDKEIRKERAAGNVVMVKMEWSIQGISAVGVVAKERKGVIKFRPVWDYSRPEDVGVNSRIDLEKEKFSSIKDAYALLRPGLWMAKLDLTAAYRSVPVAAMYWIAHVFEWDEEVVYGLSLYTRYAHALLAQARGRVGWTKEDDARVMDFSGHNAWGNLPFSDFIDITMSLEGWVDIYFMTWDVSSSWSVVYFVVLIMFGSLFVLTLATAVVFAHFSRTKDEEDRKQLTMAEEKVARSVRKFKKASLMMCMGNDNWTDVTPMKLHSEFAAAMRRQRLWSRPSTGRKSGRMRSVDSLVATLETQSGPPRQGLPSRLSRSLSISLGSQHNKAPLRKISSVAPSGSPPRGSSPSVMDEVLQSAETQGPRSKRRTHTSVAGDKEMNEVMQRRSNNGKDQGDGGQSNTSLKELAPGFAAHVASTRYLDNVSKGRDPRNKWQGLFAVIHDKAESTSKGRGEEGETVEPVSFAGQISLLLDLTATGTDILDPEEREEHEWEVMANIVSSHGWVKGVFLLYGQMGLRKTVKYILGSSHFQKLIMLLIFGNTACLSMEHYDMDPSFQSALDSANLMFLTLFALEMLLKILVLGPLDYCADQFNLFDCFVVLVSIIEVLPFVSGPAGFSVLRAFRLMRVVKLLRTWTSIRSLLTVVITSLLDIANFTLVMSIIMFTFALLGMELFAGEMCVSHSCHGPGGIYDLERDDCLAAEFEWQCLRDRANFDNLFWAFLTVFQLLTAENWFEVMFTAVDNTSWVAIGYFIIILLVGHYMLLNLFLAAIMKNVQTQAQLDEVAKAHEALYASQNSTEAPGVAKAEWGLANAVDDSGLTEGALRH